MENVTAAIVVAQNLGIEDEKIKAAVADFQGVKRRFEYIIKSPSKGGKTGLVFIDDYAHHPEELRALISGAMGLFPELKCTVIFQPHLYTRTRDLVDGFAESLSLADEVYLLPIYPAREKPIVGVTSEMIANKMDESKVTCCGKEDLLNMLDGMSGSELELLITAGAGDIDALVQPIKEIIETK